MSTRVVIQGHEELYPPLKLRDLISGLSPCRPRDPRGGGIPIVQEWNLEKFLGHSSGFFGGHEAAGLVKCIQDGRAALQTWGGELYGS